MTHPQASAPLTAPDHQPGQPGCPYATHALPGLGGFLAADPQDFQVEELPAYEASGEGEHFFVQIRKTGLTTGQAKDALARAAGVDPRDVGAAGRKDKWAVTTQWLSMQKPPGPIDDPRLEVLAVTRHGNKLRMGHLQGNRFTVRLRGLHPAAAERLPPLAAALAGGVPNYFGEQRFGIDNLRAALALLDDPRRGRGKDAGFLASALQSAVFNHWLGARVAAGDLHRLVPGDVLQKRATGGLFTSTDPAADAPRLAAGEVDPTGPLVGPKAFAAGDEAAAREQAALAAFGLTQARLAALARLAPGSRRRARLVLDDLELHLEGDTLLARFSLPPGAFATVVLGELAHPEGPLRRRPEGPDASP